MDVNKKLKDWVERLKENPDEELVINFPLDTLVVRYIKLKKSERFIVEHYSFPIGLLEEKEFKTIEEVTKWVSIL